MSVYIHHISTVTPLFSAPQQKIRELMKSKLGDDRRTRAIIHRIYTQSGIGKRHSVIEDMLDDQPDGFFFRAMDPNDIPGTAERNAIYKREGAKLFTGAGDSALRDNGTFQKKDITHVITVSCTGFYAPGPDIEVVHALDLSPDVERTHVGFMGCYAVFPALKLARSICKADPDAVVLLVSAELCTLHFQFAKETDDLLASSVFADGAAAAIVSSKPPQSKGIRLDEFATSLATEGEQDMAWTIGDAGFNMVLSSYVPDIIGSSLRDILTPLFERQEINPEQVDRWAIHPGGRAILDKVQEAFDLDETALSASRSVLHNYGNMSSSTILFVLDHILQSESTSDMRIVPMAFGPGLTVETGMFTYYSP